MKASIIAVILASCSVSNACMAYDKGCHDGPPRPLGLEPGVLGQPNSLTGPKPSKPNSPKPKVPGLSKPGLSKPSLSKPGTKPSIKIGTSDPRSKSAKAKRELYEYLEARGYFDDDEAEYVTPDMALPYSADPYAQHIFIRLNTIPKEYPPFGQVDHSGLNKLMYDLGGQHVDLVYGTTEGYRQCGMNLVDMEWTQTHSNADGYPVTSFCTQLRPGAQDAYMYIGELHDRNITRLSHELLKGKTYDHQYYHCGTFVMQALHVLGFV